MNAEDRIDGKGEIPERPAPFLVAPKWAGDHLWIGPVMVGYVSRPVCEGDKRGLIGTLSSLIGDDAKEFGRDQEKETRAYVEGVVKQLFSASPEAKP